MLDAGATKFQNGSTRFQYFAPSNNNGGPVATHPVMLVFRLSVPVFVESFGSRQSGPQ